MPGAEGPRAATIVLIDDEPEYFDQIRPVLASLGSDDPVYRADPLDAIEYVGLRRNHIDCVLLDVRLAGSLKGDEVARELRRVGYSGPLVAVTGDPSSQLDMLGAGVDDFVDKSSPDVLRARLQGHIERARATRELTRVNEQLRQFLAPDVADLATQPSVMDESREIAALFFDIRGFTRFTQNSSAQVVMRVLREYHSTFSPLVEQHRATVLGFQGDGILMVFNAPHESDGHPVDEAMGLCRDVFGELEHTVDGWNRRGYDIGVGAGLAYEFATTGIVGFDSCRQYTAIGPVVNLAARLCGDAEHGTVLMSQRALAECGGAPEAQPRIVDVRGIGDVQAFSVRLLPNRPGT